MDSEYNGERSGNNPQPTGAVDYSHGVPPDTDNPTPELFQAVIGAMGQMPKIAESGGGKESKVPYKYLSEKEILPAILPILVIHGLFLYPCRQLKNSEYRNGKMTTRHITTRYRLCHTGGGYVHIETNGEGFDAGDKSSYKAMTGAYKYAIRQLFMLSGGEDPDNTPSVSPDRERGQPARHQGGTRELSPEIRFRLCRDSLANAQTIPEVEKLMNQARNAGVFSTDQIKALENVSLTAAAAMVSHSEKSGEIPI